MKPSPFYHRVKKMANLMSRKWLDLLKIMRKKNLRLESLPAVRLLLKRTQNSRGKWCVPFMYLHLNNPSSRLQSRQTWIITFRVDWNVHNFQNFEKERTFLFENQIGSVSLQDILNHILNDVEVFIGRIAAAGAKNLKKNKKKKKGNSSASIICIIIHVKQLRAGFLLCVPAVKGMPSAEEFAACLQKIKYGFNLLVCVFSHACMAPSDQTSQAVMMGCLWQGELNGLIKDPSAADFVHSLFSTLKFVSFLNSIFLLSHFVLFKNGFKPQSYLD